jgi:rubrerythrin
MLMHETDKVLGLIHQAIQIERFGFEFYTSLKSCVKDRNGQKMLSHLAGLEIEHMNWLEREYGRQLDHMSEFDEAPEVNVSLLAEENIFLVDDRLPDVIKGLDEAGALKYAIDIEKRSIKFYKDNMEFGGGDRLRELFQKLADFEEDHLKLLEDNLSHLEKEGAWKPREKK